MFMDKRIKKRTKYNKIIEKFMTQKRTPAWSMSLSDRQMLAADNLLPSLRDDMNQGTTHRVRAILETIGIFPLVSPRSIRFAMNLSYANDLAFLWFLMELYYTTKNETYTHYPMSKPLPAYTISQQLIMSVIAHLDMITTLRELDKLLPHQQKKPPIKNNNDNKLQLKKMKSQNRKLPIIQKQSSNRAVKIYLEPLVEPKPQFAKKCPPPRDTPVSIYPYEKYADPHYIVPNEQNRWFAHPNYQRNLSGRISSINIVRGILSNEVKKFLTSNPETYNSKDLITICNQHKEMEKERKTLMNQLQVAAREKCFKYFSDDGKKDYLRKRFEKQLEIDLQKTKLEFEQLSQRYQTQTWLRLILHQLVDENINLKNIKLCDQKDSCSMDVDLLKGILEQDKYYSSSHKSLMKSNINVEKSRSISECKHNHQHSHANCIYHQSNNNDLNLVHNHNNLNPFNHNENSKHLEFGYHGEPKRHDTFFHRPKTHQPYKFDYPRIFNRNDLKSPRDPEKLIHNSISAALDIERYLDEDEAITGCLKRIWKNEVKLWNEKFKTMDEHHEQIDHNIFTCPAELNLTNNNRKSIDNNNNTRDSKKILNYKENQYYDPRDDNLIESMLKNALCHMKQNPKFVLASLPDVYKLDILKQWLKRRFGLIYTQAERNEALKKTRIIITQMRKMKYSAKPPRPNDLGAVEYVPYRCHKYIFRKTTALLDSYYHRLKNRLLDDVKIYWQAFEPFHCKGGIPRNVFYAYLPSKESEILPFRTWKNNHYRDMEQASKARQKLKYKC